jgi:predicted porin
MTPNERRVVDAGIASIAQTQSSITLYGELDNAVAYCANTGQASLVKLQGADLKANPPQTDRKGSQRQPASWMG